jgi:hypothetical protein
MAIADAWRTSRRSSSSSLFEPNTEWRETTPMMVPPGRLRLTASDLVAPALDDEWMCSWPWMVAEADRGIGDDHCRLPAD